MTGKPDSRAGSWPNRIGLADLHPAYFAMVMATGIISIACELFSLTVIARVLLGLNITFYAVLCLLFAVRFARYGQRVWADLSHHGRAVGFFTMVAATCVLGSQFIVVVDVRVIAVTLWIVGILLWALLTYGVFTILTVRRSKPNFDASIHGGWLVAVVAAQSVAVLGAQLAPGFGASAPFALFFALAMWLGAGMLYIWIISLIFYRYMFFVLEPSDLAPPYWINMGAMAISTLAGTMLIAATPSYGLLHELLPFVKGLTLLFWSTATWWIPMLLILGIWRHGIRRFPLRYDPLYWGADFPLGMYAAATLRLTQVVEAPFLVPLAHAFVFIALAAWSLTLLGLVLSFRASAKPI